MELKNDRSCIDGYEGQGLLPHISKDIPHYNMICLYNPTFPKGHPDFPFYLWGNMGLGVIHNEEELRLALIKNSEEGERRHKARV